MEFTRRFDMRNIPRKTFLERMQRLDQQARGYFGVTEVNRAYSSAGTDTIVTWTPGREPGPAAMAGLADVLDKEVKQLNGGKVMANVTGAKALGDLFRNHLAAVKAQLAEAGSQMDTAMGELKDTASQATEMVKAVKAETADLKQSLGLHTNNPPDGV